MGLTTSTSRVFKTIRESQHALLEGILSILEREHCSGARQPLTLHSSSLRPNRSGRSRRSSVRQTFAARKAAKVSDSGGGSSDPDRRQSPRKTSSIYGIVFTALIGGEK